MAYSDQDIIDDLDAVAKIQDLLNTALGDGSGSTSISARAKAVRTRVLAEQEYDTESKYLNGANEFYQRCRTEAEYTTVQSTPGVMGAPLWAGLRALLGDLKSALNSRDIRMHPKAADNYKAANNGTWPDPSMVFALQTSMGTLSRAASVWTFVDGQAIDDDLYSPATLEIYCNTAIGAAAITVTLTLKTTEEATPVQVQVVVPASSPQGTTISVGSIKYVDVTAASATGGTDGEQLTVRSVQERDPLA